MRTYLKIDGVESELMELTYKFNRKVDSNGKVLTRIQKGEIEITKDSIFDKNSMMKWLADQDVVKEGEITIYQDDLKQNKFKKITFENAKITDYKESFIRQEGLPVIEKFTISAEKIKVEDAKQLDFQWPENQA